MNNLPTVKIYTDGACLTNPGGPGGIGTIIQQNGKKTEISKGYPIAKEGESQVTNNRMEIQAIIEGLKSLKEPSSVLVYSDSQYAINCARGIWQKTKNIDLWIELEPLMDLHRVRFEWVRGHSDDELNNRCDEIAGIAAKALGYSPL